MLPSLSALQALSLKTDVKYNDDDKNAPRDGGSTKKGIKKEEKVAAAKSAAAKSARKRVDKYGDAYLQLLNAHPDLVSLHKFVTVGTPTKLAEDFFFVREELSVNLQNQLILSTLVRNDFFFFSCHPAWHGGSPMVGRFEADSMVVTDVVPMARAEEITNAITSALAWRDGDADCGTSNCFVSSLRVDASAMSVAGVAVRNAISFFAPDVAIPTVSVRAPKSRYLLNENLLFKLQEAYTELFLTLRMSRYHLSPPLLLAMPVHRLLEEDFYQGNVGFCYVTEDGWTELHKTLNGAPDADLPKIGIAIIDCLVKTAQQTILLFDIKALNMVAKKTDDSYDVRMIDFDSIYTVDVNLFGTLPKTTHDCVFFVNSLLLINHAIASEPEKIQKLAFKVLTTRLITIWRYMKQSNPITAFCGKFARDAHYGGGLETDDDDGHTNRSIRNMSSIMDETAFFVELQAALYERLAHYNILLAMSQEPPTPSDSAATSQYYIDRLLVRIQKHFQIKDSEIDATLARLKKQREPEGVGVGEGGG